MSQYDANLQPHGNKATTKDDHESSPGFMHKIADKLGIHSSDKSGDHHKDVYGSKVATASTTHTDHHKHAGPIVHQTHEHDNDPNRVHDKDSKPGIVHKIADKLGIHSDHKDKKAVETSSTAHGRNLDHLHNYQTGVRDNDPNRAHHHETHVTTGTGGTSSTSHSQQQQQHHGNIDIGGYPVQQQTHHDNKAPGTEQYHDSNSPGFKEKIKSKLGMDKPSDHQKKDQPENLFGLPPSNPHDQDHYARGFAAGQPPVAGESHTSDQHNTYGSHSILPKKTPQAEAGSIYSSSLIDNTAVTGEYNRQTLPTSAGNASHESDRNRQTLPTSHDTGNASHESDRNRQTLPTSTRHEYQN